MHRIQFKATTGDIVFCDSKTEPPTSGEIRNVAKNGRYLCLTTEDEITYDIGLVFDSVIESVNGYKFEPIGGYYGISVPSGKLVIASTENWLQEKPEDCVDVEAGEYIAQIYTQEFDYSKYREQLVNLAGENAIRYWEWVDKLGAYAWIPTLLFFLSLLSSTGRSNWYWGILVVVAFWLPYYTLKRTTNYKRVERAQREHDLRVPNQFVYLQKLPPGQNIPGGYTYID